MSNLSKTDNYDVVIVGMGPTGLVLANLLGLEELNVLVIDKFLTPYDLPRAVHLDDEIMRILQVIGVASEMEKIMRPKLGMRFVDVDNNLLLDSAEKSFIDRSSSSAAFINNETGILRFPLSIKFK